MAVSTTQNTNVKTKDVSLTNLAQYTVSGYYVTVPDIRSKADIPATAKIVALTLIGWGGLGTNPALGLSGSGAIWVFFTSGTSITSSSYATVQIAYI